MNRFVYGVDLTDEERDKFLEVLKGAFPDLFDDEAQVSGADTVDELGFLVEVLRS